MFNDKSMNENMNNIQKPIEKGYNCECGCKFKNLLELVKHEIQEHSSALDVASIEEMIFVLRKLLNILKKRIKVKEPYVEKITSEIKNWPISTDRSINDTNQRDDLLPLKACTTKSFDKINSTTNSKDKKDDVLESYICDICGKSYTKKQRLQQHMIRNHMVVKTHCHICGIYYRDLTRHLETHDTDPEFVCDICGFKCRGKLHLITHKKRQHKELPKRFFCATCGTGYHYAYELKRHEISHDPDQIKKYFCPVCNKGFSRKFTMTKHYRAHTEHYDCSHCGKSLRRKSDLMFHVKTQHADFSQFKELCELCDASFTMKRYLKRHMSSKHGVLKSENIL